MLLFLLIECTKAMDVVFLVDGSTAVGFNNFQTLKTAVRHAALYYVISQSNTRVGVISYSTSVTGGFPPTGDRYAVDLGKKRADYERGWITRHYYSCGYWTPDLEVLF